MPNRKTIQQRLIMEAAQELRHPSAEDIYQNIVGRRPGVSRGTVYRNLHRFIADGKLRRVSLPGNADRFDITTEPHYHAACMVCGNVRDAALPYQTHLADLVSPFDDFAVKTHEIVFWGVCGQCAEKTSL